MTVQAVVLCMLAEHRDAELMTLAKARGITSIKDKCHDCDREIIRAEMAVGVAAEDFDLDNPNFVAIPTDRVYVCGWCAADRADEEGDWEKAASFRYATRVAEGGYED